MITFVMQKVQNNKAAKHKITVLQLQQICRFLNFLGRAVILGRAFTRRLYRQLKNKNLKPHHHIRINNEMVMDLQIWLLFLKHQSVLCRPFMNFTKLWQAEEIQFYMDAFGNSALGFGGHCESAWMQAKWGNLIDLFEPSIEYLELFALAAGLLAWMSQFENKRIVVYSDNMSVCYMLNKMTSSCKNCMILIRLIVLNCLIHNVRVYVKHVPSFKNDVADSLSRFQDARLEKILVTNRMTLNDYPTPVLALYLAF